MVPTIGTFVNYRAGEEVKPAIVVQVWNEYCVNLQVFIDGSNDKRFFGEKECE